jgi:hypothetical protein
MHLPGCWGECRAVFGSLHCAVAPLSFRSSSHELEEVWVLLKSSKWLVTDWIYISTSGISWQICMKFGMDLPLHAIVCVFRYSRCGERCKFHVRGVRIPVARSPWQLNFVQWRPTSLGPQCGTCVMLPIGNLKFGGDSCNVLEKKNCVSVL